LGGVLKDPHSSSFIIGVYGSMSGAVTGTEALDKAAKSAFAVNLLAQIAPTGASTGF
jgi:hypothetical protein